MDLDSAVLQEVTNQYFNLSDKKLDQHEINTEEAKYDRTDEFQSKVLAKLDELDKGVK